MADHRQAIASALYGVVLPGRYGQQGGAPGVSATELTGFELATLTARKGRSKELAQAVSDVFSLDLPMTPRLVDGPAITMLWTGSYQWLAIAKQVPPQGIVKLLAGPLQPHAAIADQSHARTILRLTGPRVRDCLAKGIPIDLHPRTFKPGDTAATVVAHIGIQIWQTDSDPTYEVAVFRGFAVSLWRWLEVSAAEYGLELAQ